MNKNNYFFTSISLIALIIIGLSGCGGSTTGTGAGLPEPNDADYTGYLAEVESDAQLESFVTNSVQQSVINLVKADPVFSETESTRDTAEVDLTSEGLSNDSLSSDDQTFSQTTLIEQGVDEMDLVKFDGNTIFQRCIHPKTGIHSVRLLRANDNATTTIINTLDVNTTNTDIIDGLYLYQEEGMLILVVISLNFQYTYYDCPEDTACISLYGFSQQSSYKVSRFNVSDTENPILLGEKNFSGSLNQTRRIKNKLYTVSGLSFVSAYTSDNGRRPEDISVSDIIPKVVDEQNREQDWFSSTACYVPENVTTTGFQLYMTVITSTDLNTGNYTANCFVGYANDFYASTNAMYFTESVWQDNLTRIHQFDFTDTGVSYAGSGSVIGYLSGSSASSFKMSEYNGYLRVLSSKRDNFGFIEPAFVDTAESDLDLTSEAAIVEVAGADHYLTVLQKVEGRKELQVVSRIPNENATKVIGKPGEDVFAVRFLGDTAYVVTFLQTDPFYTIDISDPEFPLVRGELEIPGFSSLLFPINDDYVMGIGQENGLKIDVYDVTDLDNPTRHDQYAFGQFFYSPALYDHRSISFLYNSEAETMRFAFPTQSYASETSMASSGLQLFEINGATGDIKSKGSLTTESNTSLSREWWNVYDARSIIDGDTIHYVTPRPVYSSSWDDLTEISVSE